MHSSDEITLSVIRRFQLVFRYPELLLYYEVHWYQIHCFYKMQKMMESVSMKILSSQIVEQPSKICMHHS